jgi:ubiquinone/menaquinone biosynthesis C-methylase UbiE/DNA-binding transcriptional ArsR family regulator
MPTPADELQKVFKTLSDPTRVRILRLLESEPLVVQELMEVLGMAQSRVSRHLAILREAGLLTDRRDGTYVTYRFTPPGAGPWRDTWALVSRNLRDDPTAQRDRASLERVIDARSAQPRSFFDTVGPEWDALRKVFNDDIVRARAITRLIQPGLRVADIGTGTGILALELAKLGVSVIGVDNSARMLEAAETKLEAAGVTGVEFRRGEAHRLPLEDAEVDGCFVHMVLHYLPSPADAVREMARAVKPGGAVVVVDFVRHSQEWMRQELGVVWLGFTPEEIDSWFTGAGLPSPAIEVSEVSGRGRDLPSPFIAFARRPDR